MKKRKGRTSATEDSDSEVPANLMEEKMDVESDDERDDAQDGEKDEKQGPDDDDDDDDDEEEEEEMEEEGREEDVGAPDSASRSTPFMDSFYGLSSTNGKDRAQAAHIMLQHCLIGDDANIKDASYALRRLMNGLCSGRAAARQGNASALASFLKLSFQLDKIQKIILGEDDDSAPKISNLIAEIRNRLIKATDPSQISGKKKGSEERDYYFGRLFGILAIIRSNVLLSAASGDRDEVQAIASDFSTDLAQLFWYKKWMREPAAHALITLIGRLLAGSDIDASTNGNEIATVLVEKILIPKILRLDSSGKEIKKKNMASLLGSYSAEQIALVVYIQSQSALNAASMSFPLNKPILSSESLPVISKELSETSSVVQPRVHLVWDSIWTYLTESTGSTGNRGRERRSLRERCPIGDESASVLIDSLFRDVIAAKLLRMEQDETGRTTAKSTHERRSLAMCIVKNLCGATFVSSIHGSTQILLPAETIESSILPKELVRTLFLDTIVAGSQKKLSSQHLLKPLALDVLTQIAAGLSSNDLSSDESCNRQLACVRALLNCDVRFEARTKTSVVSDLLLFNSPLGTEEEIEGKIRMWNSYVSFLEQQILSSLAEINEDGVATKVTGYTELMHSAAKSIIRLETADGAENDALSTFKDSSIKSIYGLFMAASFFDVAQAKALKSKKKKSPKSNPIIQSLLTIGESVEAVPFSVRSVIASRFFSLLSEHVYTTVSKSEASNPKEARMLDILTTVNGYLSAAEDGGAPRYCPLSAKTKAQETDDDGEESQDPKKLVLKLTERLQDSTVSGEDHADPRKQFAISGAILGLTMYLHLLKCGGTADIIDGDEINVDDEDDEEEITEILSEINDNVDSFLNWKAGEDNPLVSFTELCANILSSPLGSGTLSRGTSPKLIKESVRFGWIGGLTLSASLSSKGGISLLDLDVANTLLEAIGAGVDNKLEDEEELDDEDGESDGESDGEQDEESDDDDDDDDDGSSLEKNGSIFAKAAAVATDSDDMDVETPEADAARAQTTGSDDEDDISVDAERLQSMLEEDGDAEVDVGELEHHEGADAALAQLIKLKQEARKAGQQATEKLEIANQIRCSVLLEILMAKQESWSDLLRVDIMLHFLVPILNHRRNAEQSLEKTKQKGGNSTLAGKRSLVERMTNLLKSKLCKMKLASAQFTKSTDALEYLTALAAQIMDLVRKSSTKEQTSCCSAALLFILRSVPDESMATSVAACYSEAVQEWSTKRTSRLESGLFADFINSAPSLAQQTLVTPVAQAAEEARSSFLKSESFRLLALLLAVKRQEYVSSPKLLSRETELAALFEATLKNEEMANAKRIRVVFKAMEKYIVSMATSLKDDTVTKLGNSSELLESIAASSKNQGTKNAAEKLKQLLDQKLADASNASNQSNSAELPTASGGTGKKSKSKKKSKTKKKR